MDEAKKDEFEAIRMRADEIARGPDAGTPEENWRRAESEYRRPSADEDAVRRDENEIAESAESRELLAAYLASLTHP